MGGASPAEPGGQAPDGEEAAEPAGVAAARERHRRRPSHARAQEGELEAYRVQLARHVAERAASQLYEGPPPAMLRSVVVLGLTVDASGRLVDWRVLRDNGDTEAVRLALASVRDATPLPGPPAGITRRGRVSVVETWLFRGDGRFQLRSLAVPQGGG